MAFVLADFRELSPPILAHSKRKHTEVTTTTMKLLKKQINEKDGAGSVVLRAEEPEDMWHVYNLIHVHDSVKTTTIRKVLRLCFVISPQLAMAFPRASWRAVAVAHVLSNVCACACVRQVVKEGATGSTSSQRVRMTLQIEVRLCRYHPRSL